MDSIRDWVIVASIKTSRISVLHGYFSLREADFVDIARNSMRFCYCVLFRILFHLVVSCV